MTSDTPSGKAAGSQVSLGTLSGLMGYNIAAAAATTYSAFDEHLCKPFVPRKGAGSLMPQMIAKRPMYYAGTRKVGERFDVPSPLSLVFAASGDAKYAEDEGEAVKTKRRYKRRDMVAQ